MFDKNFKKPVQPRHETPAEAGRAPAPVAERVEDIIANDMSFDERLKARAAERPRSTLKIQSKITGESIDAVVDVSDAKIIAAPRRVAEHVKPETVRREDVAAVVAAPVAAVTAAAISPAREMQDRVAADIQRPASRHSETKIEAVRPAGDKLVESAANDAAASAQSYADEPAAEGRVARLKRLATDKKERRPYIYGPPPSARQEESASNLQVFAAASIAVVGAAGLSILGATYLLGGSGGNGGAQGPIMAGGGSAGGGGATPSVTAKTDTAAGALMASVAAPAIEETFESVEDSADTLSDAATGAVDSAMNAASDAAQDLAGLADSQTEISSADMGVPVETVPGAGETDIAAADTDAPAVVPVERIGPAEETQIADASPEADVEASTETDLAESPATAPESEPDYQMAVVDDEADNLPMGGPDVDIADFNAGAADEITLAATEIPSIKPRVREVAAARAVMPNWSAPAPSVKPEAVRLAAATYAAENPRPAPQATRRSAAPKASYDLSPARVRSFSGAIQDSPQMASDFMAARIVRGASGDIAERDLEAFRANFLTSLASATDGETVTGSTPDGRSLNFTVETSRITPQSMPTVRTIDYGMGGYDKSMRFVSDVKPAQVNITCRDISYAIPGSERGRFAACRTVKGDWTLAKASDQGVSV